MLIYNFICFVFVLFFFRIVASQLSDSGLYRCFASNFLGESYVEANLTVVGKKIIFLFL